MATCYFCGDEIDEVRDSSIVLLPVTCTGKVLVTHDDYEEHQRGHYYLGECPFAHKACFAREKEKELVQWRKEEADRKIESGCWICGSKDLYNPHHGVPFDFCCKCGKERGYYSE
ncbi:MAG: hypothetical protein NTY53_07550 [Kiritimatiellaeota bacterium]|nr:hypothetical protein [Kiritimatiellota bacterium]